MFDSSVLAAVGGMLDSFMYLGHGHVFANSMTGNVVLLAVNTMQREWTQAVRHILPIVSFIVGISTAKAFVVPPVAPAVRDPELAVLALEIVMFGILGFLPDTTSDFLITISIAFAASFQTEVFRNVRGYSYNSTFTTGNLRTFSESLFAWLLRRTSEPAGKLRTFAVICAVFFMGAFGGAFLTPLLHNRTLWVVCFLLAFLPGRLIVRAGSEAHLP